MASQRITYAAIAVLVIIGLIAIVHTMSGVGIQAKRLAPWAILVGVAAAGSAVGS